MQSFERTKRTLIVTVCVTFLFCGGLGAVFYYFLNLNSEVVALVSSVEESKKEGEQVLALKKILQDVAGSKETLDSLFVTADNEAEFIKSLESLASTTLVTLDITSLRHEPGPAKNRFEYAVVQGNVTGNLSNVYQFFNLLSRFPKALEVRQLQFEAMPLENKKKERVWRGSFVARTLKIK